MEAHRNCFERLSDDLVGQIFEKLLWNPNTFTEPKALQRLRLEAVCKRFQELVHNAGCLDWDFNQSEDESAFLRYMLQQRKCASLLTKVALVVEHPVNLAAILQSIILQAQDSLEEIHLFMGGAGAASIIDFEYMLLMFQACKELATLEVLYWTREPQVFQRLLCNDWLPKPFAQLRTLTLQGFAVSPLRFDAFIERFPSLTSLELNCLTGATYTLRSGSLKKVFWWGNEAAGIDTENPSRIGVPRSLEKVVALLDSRSVDVREKAVRVLLALASNAGSRVAIAQAPGCLQRLGALLQTPNADPQTNVPGILWYLASDDDACRLIVQTPGIVRHLAELLTNAPLEAVNGDVLGAVQSLAAEFEARTVIANVPGCLQRIIDLLGCGPMRELAACVLEKVVCDDELCEAIPEVHGLLEKLVGLMDAGIPDEALEPVTVALMELGCRFQACVVALPGCLQKLLSLLHSPSSHAHRAAGEILWFLGASPEYVDKVWEVPGIQAELVGLLACASVSAQVQAVKILNILAADAAKVKVIASMPRCLESLFALLGTSESVVAERAEHMYWSTVLLGTLTEEVSVQRATLETPGVMRRLVEILASDKDYRYLLESTTRILLNLVAKPANSKTVAAVPGCLERLGAMVNKLASPLLQASVLAVLAEDMAIGKTIAAMPGALAGLVRMVDVSNMGKDEALKALKNLAADSETARAIAAVPGSIQKLERYCTLQWPDYEPNPSELRELAAQILCLLGVEPGEAGALEGGRPEETSGGWKAGEAAEPEQ